MADALLDGGDAFSTYTETIDGGGYELPPGVVPIRDLTTSEILYGSRVTAVRFELLTHDPATGLDNLTGYLDGVELDGSLTWASSEAVKRSGTMTVLDLDTAAAGLTRIRDIDLVTTRIRPVLTVQGLPDQPLGVYVITAAPEEWTATGRRFKVEIHDKSTVLNEDLISETYAVTAGTNILSAVQSVIVSAGETFTVDASQTAVLKADQSWPVGTPKLQIVNDLLAVLLYNSLRIDGVGAFKATPYVDPADRPTSYAVLNDANGDPLARELVDGDASIYSADWNLTRDSYQVPNRVVAQEQGTGTGAPLEGVATNTNPASPYSEPSRGRYIVKVLPSVPVPAGSDADVIAFLEGTAQRSLVALSAVQASVSVSCLPIPIDLLDAIRFQSTPAGVDARHTVQGVTVGLSFDGLMGLTLQEVVSV